MHQRRSPLLHLICTAIQSCGRVGLSRSAAALAYYLVLSLFPVLLFLHGLIARFHLDLTNLLTSLRPLLPAGVFTLLTDYLAQTPGPSAPGLFWAGLITIALSASAGLRTLFRAFDDLFSLPHRRGAGHLFSSVLLSLLVPLTIHLSLLVIFAGDWLIHLVETALPNLLVLTALWSWLRYVLLFGLILLLVLMLYRLGIPRDLVSNQTVLLAALVASLALAGSSMVFSHVFSLSARYALVYGSLASLAILLVWLYLCGSVLLLGAVFIHTVSIL